MKRSPEYFQERVEIDPNTGCWNWKLAILTGGYGQAKVAGRSVLAHRLSYTSHVGEIGEGLQLDHLCRNRKCVNPDHLEPVTPTENYRRGMGVGALNSKKTSCHKGHPFSGDNLFQGKRRRCRECSRQHARLQAAKKIAQNRSLGLTARGTAPIYPLRPSKYVAEAV